MSLRDLITTESWIEDVQFALAVFSREEPQLTKLDHIRDYLANRYRADVADSEFLAVQASYNWLVRNWEELGDIGLRISGENGSGFINAILFALHNLVFRDPRPVWWEQVPFVDSKEVIREAQRFIDAERNANS